MLSINGRDHEIKCPWKVLNQGRPEKKKKRREEERKKKLKPKKSINQYFFFLISEMTEDKNLPAVGDYFGIRRVTGGGNRRPCPFLCLKKEGE